MVDRSYEYPILDGVLPSKEIASFGISFNEDQTSVQKYGELNPDAVRLMDRSGWK
jgi:iron(III) transport system substrate-binding protein